MKIKGQLAIELTQRCNMTCSHCLQGDSREVGISEESIDATLSEYGIITDLCFAGGEPTLNMPAMRYTIDRIRHYGIEIEHFRVITNGLLVTEEFKDMIAELDAMQQIHKNSICLSLDLYHSEIPEENKAVLQSDPLYCSDYELYNQTEWLNIGRAKENGIGTVKRADTDNKPLINEIIVSEDFLCTGNNIIYLTALGNVCFGCAFTHDEETLYARLNVNHQSLVEYLQGLINHTEGTNGNNK